MKPWVAAISPLVAAVLSIPLLPSAAAGAESALVKSERTTASLVAETNAAMPGVAFTAALRLVLAPGWHTYWQNPGDAGIPPSLDLTLLKGTSAGPLQWPVPHRVAEGTLTTYAYTGDVVLPFTVTPGDASAAIHAHAQWLACREICVPEEADLELQLPSGPVTAAPEAALIAAAEARVPRPATFAATVTPSGMLALTGASVPTDIVSAEFFPSKDGAVQGPLQQVVAQDGNTVVPLGPLYSDGRNATVPGVLSLTSRSGATSAFELSATVVPETASGFNLIVLLVFALAGGLLLNAMPCVFPILAMKALALAKLSHADLRRVRGEAASYSLGVVISFIVLGAGLVALRSAGQVTGWGFQFQSPSFVTAIAWLLFAVGLSLSGVFTIGGNLVGRGDALARRGGHVGSFLTGVLAVVVASPCTAPFMGTAIAGALALSNAACLTVFAALGIGLALPYGVIALVPRLTKVLPRPGAWMQVLQRFLAFPLYAAVVWLVWVASQQSGSAGVLVAGAGLVLIGFAAWLFGLAEQGGTPKAFAPAVAFVAVLSLGAILYEAGQANAQALSEPFTTARLDELRSQGRPVFVNMTASWCLSCLVNEQIALSPTAVRDAFSHGGVAYLKGDWTNQDPAISSFLHQLGQDGVPLYVLYPPGGAPIVLPQLLTEGIVLDGLAKLKG